MQDQHPDYYWLPVVPCHTYTFLRRLRFLILDARSTSRLLLVACCSVPNQIPNLDFSACRMALPRFLLRMYICVFAVVVVLVVVVWPCVAFALFYFCFVLRLPCGSQHQKTSSRSIVVVISVFFHNDIAQRRVFYMACVCACVGVRVVDDTNCRTCQ